MSDDLVVRDLTVRYGDVLAVDHVSLYVPGGTLAALVGPSGCGKTSVLRAIAGFETPAGGSIRAGSESLDPLPPEKRRVGMLFQQGALFPHLTVLDNVAFGLPRRSDPRALDALRLVGMEGLRERRPHELSGGQQQRVALARALAPRPRLMLLDEPFAALDAPLRVRLREDVREILRQTGMTAMLVTHDQEEALSIADEVSVMREGRILQSGTPRAVYDDPASLDVARLVGDANLLDAAIRGGVVDTPVGTLRADAPDGPCVVRIATESLRVGDGGRAGVIVGSRFYGHDVVDEVRMADGRSVRVRLPRSAGEVGSTVRVALKGTRYHVFLADGRAVSAAVSS
ncbi:MAG TPA: ABC transporter ATP-binding protein [Thermoanaerobaculia bacterium]|nr:ABC transporter ATP-binding protein [Thermoanaerobaculia bacterium]